MVTPFPHSVSDVNFFSLSMLLSFLWILCVSFALATPTLKQGKHEMTCASSEQDKLLENIRKLPGLPQEKILLYHRLLYNLKYVCGVQHLLGNPYSVFVSQSESIKCYNAAIRWGEVSHQMLHPFIQSIFDAPWINDNNLESMIKTLEIWNSKKRKVKQLGIPYLLNDKLENVMKGLPDKYKRSVMVERYSNKSFSDPSIKELSVLWKGGILDLLKFLKINQQLTVLDIRNLLFAEEAEVMQKAVEQKAMETFNSLESLESLSLRLGFKNFPLITNILKSNPVKEKLTDTNLPIVFIHYHTTSTAKFPLLIYPLRHSQ